MIKNIIFDLGNVIVQNPTPNIVEKFFKEKNDGKNFYEYIFKSEFWKMMDLGQITNEEVANVIENQRLIEVSDYTEVKNFMLNWFKEIIENKDTIEVGKALKCKGYNIYVLSNMAKSTYEYLAGKYDFFNIIDGAVVSAYEGMKKPDLRIFNVLLERYSLLAEECLLIDDDDTNKTFEAANSIGIKGRRVNPNDVEDVKKSLIENNVEL
ncbi:MAG: HAD family phosphatase [Clostridia bacterium]|nr:HAD family phosphatase [Clostridia bacterium]